jgi:hypothetical protein
MLGALAEHGPKSLKIHEGLLGEMVSDTLVAVGFTTVRREQSPAMGSGANARTPGVGVHAALRVPSGCVNADRVLGTQVLMPRGDARFRVVTERVEPGHPRLGE